MNSKAETVEEYINELPSDRRAIVNELREVILSSLPTGFEETMSYGMIGYVVPLTIFPDGYHCNPNLPLPFINLASQKNFIALYHMGIYSSTELMEWFTDAYSKSVKGKLDMGKSCIRFKKIDQIPVHLIGELCKKMTVQDWITLYQNSIKKK